MDVSGSSYEGDTVAGEFHGSGTYTFPNGDKYVGMFQHGRFHGEGVMHINGAGSFKARWVNGEVVEGTYKFADGLDYGKKGWKYCTLEDRRYFTEQEGGIRPAGASQLTNEPGYPRVREGTFDIGTGFYDPRDGKIYDADSRQAVGRLPTEDEKAWIVDKARIGTSKLASV